MTVRSDAREQLLRAADALHESASGAAVAAEAERTLPRDTVDALRSSGLTRFKGPTEVGGFEADPLTQVEVLERVARADGAAGWCLAIQGGISGMIGAFLPDAGAARVFGKSFPCVAGAFAPKGLGRRVTGGLRVSGRWNFGSGIRHSEWVLSGLRVEGEQGAAAQWIAVVPTREVEIHDNWYAAGLCGTGSCDYSLDDVFIPNEMTFPAFQVAQGRAARGGASFRMGLPGFVAMEHAAIALGIGQRALAEICHHAGSKKRGGLAPGTEPTLLAQRGAFQNELGRSLMNLRAARNLVFDVFGAAWETACAGSVPDSLAQAEMRCAARAATDIAVEVAGMAGRYAGGGALFETHPIQRCVRDLYAASQHFVVADTAYEALGQMTLGRPDTSPMS